MKKNLIFGALSAAALLFAGACSNDMLDQNKNQGGLLNTDDTSGGVYLAVDFKMPTGAEGTRSETLDPGADDNPNHYNSDGGTEVGTPEENFVSSALIVLAATEAKGDDIKKYGFLVAGEVPSNRIATSNATEGRKLYRATAKLQKEYLNSLYQLYGATGTGSSTEEGEEGETTTTPAQKLPEVYVFVFANPTTDLSNLIKETKFGTAEWINATCEVLQTTDATQSKNVGIWGTNSFLMNNVHLATRELPQFLLDWENFSTVEKPFHLSGSNTAENMTTVDNSDDANRGAVLVERSVARFDFKDGSTLGENRYNVLLNTKADGDFDNAKPIVDVQIQKMCLVNMCNKFYYLPRVSSDGMDVNTTLCGVEKPWFRNPTTGLYSDGNYVVGPYASTFGGSALMKGFSKYMNFAFFDDEGGFNNDVMSSSARWDVVKVDDVLKGTPDNYVNPNVAGASAGQYRIWRYVTENLIPENSDKQVNGISTGVVFKGKLLGSALADTENPGYYEASWNAGNIKNLANCLNGKPFTYNGTPNHTLQGNSKDDPILYYFQGQLYMGWRHIRQAAIQDAVTINTKGEVEINRSSSLYQAVFGEGGPIPTYQDDKDNDGTAETYNMVYVENNGNKITIEDPLWTVAQDNHESEAWVAYEGSANYAWSKWALNGKEIASDETGATVAPALKEMREAVTDAGITIFQSSDDKDFGAGYYCYYYYWNRHNDNHLNGSMGPMEFDVVRNNVYKLSVDKIARLGHPRIPENDPNDPTPDTPDESDEIYLDVRMEIVPWVVRLNSIQF